MCFKKLRRSDFMDALFYFCPLSSKIIPVFGYTGGGRVFVKIAYIAVFNGFYRA